jgi:hypothetical protein
MQRIQQDKEKKSAREENKKMRAPGCSCMFYLPELLVCEIEVHWSGSYPFPELVRADGTIVIDIESHEHVLGYAGVKDK